MTRIDPGCFDATKPILDYSPVRVEITYRTINSLNVTGVIKNFVHFPMASSLKESRHFRGYYVQDSSRQVTNATFVAYISE